MIFTAYVHTKRVKRIKNHVEGSSGASALAVLFRWTRSALLTCQKLKTVQIARNAPQRPSSRLHIDLECNLDAPDAQNAIGVDLCKTDTIKQQIEVQMRICDKMKLPLINSPYTIWLSMLEWFYKDEWAK